MKRAALWIAFVLSIPCVLQFGTGCTFSAAACPAAPTCQQPQEQSSPNSYTCACDCSPASRTRKITIAAGADDAEEDVPGGAMHLANVTLGLFSGGIVGLRFTDVRIPANATVTSAAVQ